MNARRARVREGARHSQYAIGPALAIVGAVVVAAMAPIGFVSACRKGSTSTSDASPATSHASDSGTDPLEALLGGPPPEQKHLSAEQRKNALVDPAFVVVGDSFELTRSVHFNCKPGGEWVPPGLVTRVGEELFAPKFPTPLRYYHALYSATAKGNASVHLACTRDSPGRIVSARAVTILDPSEAAPFVDVQGDSSAANVGPATESARAASLACYVAELARDPKVRGTAIMRIWIEKTGVISIPDREDYTGVFTDLSDTAAQCVRDAFAHAVVAQKKVPPPRPESRDASYMSSGENAEVRLRFEMVPKTVDPKACDHYRDRWKACEHWMDSATYRDLFEDLETRRRFATTNDGRTALAFACLAATQDLDFACHH